MKQKTDRPLASRVLVHQINCNNRTPATDRAASLMSKLGYILAAAIVIGYFAFALIRFLSDPAAWRTSEGQPINQEARR